MRVLLSAVFAVVLCSVGVVCAQTLYVWTNSASPSYPYGTWETAARRLQQAVDAASDGSEVVVRAGVYGPYGSGSISNDYARFGVVTLTKGVKVRSETGPAGAIIDAEGVGRAVFMDSDGAALEGFTITGGSAREGAGVFCSGGVVRDCTVVTNVGGWGAGVYCYDGALVTHCRIRGNRAGGYGGGVYCAATLRNSEVVGNQASLNGGGGVCVSTPGRVESCTVSDNSAAQGGGLYFYLGGTAVNSVVYFNTAGEAPNTFFYTSAVFETYASVSRCAVTPDPGGEGNVPNAPLFVDRMNDDYSLSPASPCIDGGVLQDWMAGEVDLATQPRIAADSVDIGAYEYGSSRGAGAAADSGGATLHVWTNSPYPGVPYNAWTNAAHTIQDAIDAAVDGDTVWVTNGVYDVGSRVAVGFSLTNRIVITNAIVVQSVNGPTNTTIVGKGPNGPDAIRCAYVCGGGLLSGFTFSNGATRLSTGDLSDRYGGGAFLWSDTQPGILSNCVLRNNQAKRGGGTYGGVVLHSVFRENYAVEGGGGAYKGALNACLISNNKAEMYSGGGSWESDLDQCVVVENEASSEGGGVYKGHIAGCTISSNSCTYGGGAARATIVDSHITHNAASSGGAALDCDISNCVLRANESSNRGGGLYWGTARGCVLFENRSGWFGGGALEAELYNCNIIANSAEIDGGGVYSGAVYNCIVSHNYAHQAKEMSGGVHAEYSCSPALTHGVDGNITNDAGLISLSHLGPGSLCMGAGSSLYSDGVDVDGESWATPPSIGCDEPHPLHTGSLSVAISPVAGSVALGHPVRLIADIDGNPASNVWTLQNGPTMTNIMHMSYTWPVAGAYEVVLSAYNNDYPLGVAATVTVHVYESPVYYVDISNSAPQAPYMSWSDAATNIQDAIDAAVPEAGLILVRPGDYCTGVNATPSSYQQSRVVLDKDVILQSTDGAEATIIRGRPHDEEVRFGDNAVRCMYLSAGVVDGFTLADGCAGGGDGVGGGAFIRNGCLSNCIVTGCSAYWYGGGVYSGVVENCVLKDNFSLFWGGGACAALVQSCSIVSNEAARGGGVAYCTVSNSWVLANRADEGGGVRESVVYNTALLENLAVLGGGAYESTLYQCTAAGNEGRSGSGTYRGAAYNSIVYHNEGTVDGANFYRGDWEHSCTWPDPGGVGNTTNDPALLGGGHIHVDSPCAGAGNPTYAGGSDLDGDVWSMPPSMGCDEPSGPFTGALQVLVSPSAWTSVVGKTVNVSAHVEGEPASNLWSYSDGPVVTNASFAARVWSQTGRFEVVFAAFNDDSPQPVSATSLVCIVERTDRYVDLASPSPAPPYTNWTTAAHVLQDAVDAACDGDVVHVADGVYDEGGRSAVDPTLTNRLVVEKDILIRSVNGPEYTTILGTQNISSVRCVYMTAGTLSGFTLANGRTRPITLYDGYIEHSGGGAWLQSACLTNCIVERNRAYRQGGGVYAEGSLVVDCTIRSNWAHGYVYRGYSGEGAGAYAAQGTILRDCYVVGNECPLNGGGVLLESGSLLEYSIVCSNESSSRGGGVMIEDAVLRSTLVAANRAVNSSYAGGVFCGEGSLVDSCTIVSNTAYRGGGVVFEHGATLLNSIVYHNRATYGTNYTSWYVTNTYNMMACCTHPEPPGGMGVDIITNDPQFVNMASGDYHLQPTSLCIDAGTNTGLAIDLDGVPRPLDGDADGLGVIDMGCYEYLNASADSDGDGVNDGDEMAADTSPVDPGSALKVRSVVLGTDGAEVTWQGGSSVRQYLEVCTDLMATNEKWQVIYTNHPPTAITNAILNSGVTNATRYYRIRAER